MNIGILTKPFGREPVKKVLRKGGWGEMRGMRKKEEVDQKGKYMLKGKNDFREEGSIKDKFWRFAVGGEGKVL